MNCGRYLRKFLLLSGLATQVECVQGFPAEAPRATGPFGTAKFSDAELLPAVSCWLTF